MKNNVINPSIKLQKGRLPYYFYYIELRLKSFVYAGQGLVYLVRTQHSSWIHIFVSLCAVSLGLYVQLSVYDWRWIALALALVWSAEAFNTALEAICDLVSPDFHPLVKIAKDVAAGAVLIVSFFAAFVGLSIFVPLLWRVFL